MGWMSKSTLLAKEQTLNKNLNSGFAYRTVRKGIRWIAIEIKRMAASGTKGTTEEAFSRAYRKGCRRKQNGCGNEIDVELHVEIVEEY